jgi:hypothetical protein
MGHTMLLRLLCLLRLVLLLWLLSPRSSAALIGGLCTEAILQDPSWLLVSRSWGDRFGRRVRSVEAVGGRWRGRGAVLSAGSGVAGRGGARRRLRSGDCGL